MAKVAPSVTSLLSGKVLTQDPAAPGLPGARLTCPADLRVALLAAGAMARSGKSHEPAGRVLSVSADAVSSGAGSVGPVPGRADLPQLLNHAGLRVPGELLQAHADAMEFLLGCAGRDGRLGAAVTDAAQQLDRLHGAFLAALPAGPAAASGPCQQIACVLVGDARLINHIHHAGEVPADRDAFMRHLGALPPSRLERSTPRGLAAGGLAS